MTRRGLFVLFLLLPAFGLPCLAQSPAVFEFTALDSFEDASAWLKGDPKTDLVQKDTAVAANTEFVKEGRQSLAFLNRINWTPRAGEQYPKGWPMISRKFPEPQDWSRYDYVCFWVYTRASRKMLPEPALKIGFLTGDQKTVQNYYSIPNIEHDRWVEVAVPLAIESDRRRVKAIYIYIAEAWYAHGDQVDFYLDDMRLARRTIPVVHSSIVSARILPRGQAVFFNVKIEGPFEEAAVRCTITDLAGREEAALTEKLKAREQDFFVPAKGLAPGGHYGVLEILDSNAKVVDSKKHYFRSLQPGKRCYLKLITFYTKPLAESDPQTLAVLNESAYAGVAIPVAGSYKSDLPPDLDALKPRLKAVREALKIDPWPWVALNRLFGAPADRQGHAASRAPDLKYFEAIKAMDLGAEGRARADYLKLWRLAVCAAREWKSPGVMWDPEAYNDYRAYHVPYVAEARGESVDDVIRQCEQLGAEMAKIIAEEYPQCLVWSLFSRLELSQSLPGRKDKIYTTPTHITLGLLKYAKENKVPLRYLCGGETTPGYCNKSVEALKEKILARDAAVASFLEEFPDHLSLAGTISPFHDYALCTSWIQKGYQDAPFKTIGDFEPMFKTLFDAYDWVWIYASSAARTLPYDPKNSQMYGAVLRAALDAAAKGR